MELIKLYPAQLESKCAAVQRKKIIELQQAQEDAVRN
jgi:hypothetical protein